MVHFLDREAGTGEELARHDEGILRHMGIDQRAVIVVGTPVDRLRRVRRRRVGCHGGDPGAVDFSGRRGQPGRDGDQSCRESHRDCVSYQSFPKGDASHPVRPAVPYWPVRFLSFPCAQSNAVGRLERFHRHRSAARAGKRVTAHLAPMYIRVEPFIAIWPLLRATCSACLNRRPQPRGPLACSPDL